MRVIPQIEVNAERLTSTNVGEPAAGETVWSNASRYKTGDRVISVATHRTYESQQGQESVVTINAGVFAWPNHGLAPTTPVILSTTGALPAGYATNTTYYVVADTVNSFKLSANIGGAAIGGSGTGTGTHTALANPNAGRDPTTDDGTWWADVGPTKKWAMFDLKSSMSTEVPSPLIVEWTLGERMDAVGFDGLIADEMLLEAIVGGVVVKSWTLDLRYRDVATWYEHLTTPFSYRSKTAIWDVPVESTMTMRMTLTRGTGNVSCRYVVPGRQVYLGRSLMGAQNGANMYARITTDGDGNTQLKPGAAKARTRQNVRFAKSRSARLVQLRRELTGRPAFWSALDDPTDGYFEPFQVVGWHDEFEMTADQPTEGILSLSLREL